MTSTASPSPDRTDVLVVGAGIVGLAHAFTALRRGLSVRVIDREHATVGASIQNFGHACLSAQAPEHDRRTQDSREGWLTASREAGFWAQEAGALFVARTEAEMSLAKAFAGRSSRPAALQDAGEVRARLGGRTDHSVLGGVFVPDDLRVDPRTAAPSLARWLADQGVLFGWNTVLRSVEPGVAHTSRGSIEAGRIVICVGHDLDHVDPELAKREEVLRCRLTMALVAAPGHFVTDTAVLTGTSMLRYAGFSSLPEAEAVRSDLAERSPALMEIGANVMFTRRPDGTLLVGDSHHYGKAAAPFLDEGVSDLLLAEISRLLGVPSLRVLERWQGVYASSPRTELLRHTHADGVESVTVTTGIGLTLSFGLAAETFRG